MNCALVHSRRSPREGFVSSFPSDLSSLLVLLDTKCAFLLEIFKSNNKKDLIQQRRISETKDAAAYDVLARIGDRVKHVGDVA